MIVTSAMAGDESGGVRMSLEDCKKQAKLLVRWHREGNYSVGGRIRQLARYAALTDIEALALPFPLREAQEIIAFEQGYANWKALKEALESNPQSARPPFTALRLTQAIPVVFVSNVEASISFYRDQLGFTIDFLHGKPAFYAAVRRDAACLHLRLVPTPVIAADLREQEQLLAAFVVVANVKELFAEFDARHVPFVHRLQEEAWGQSSFLVRDPDDNWLCFAG